MADTRNTISSAQTSASVLINHDYIYIISQINNRSSLYWTAYTQTAILLLFRGRWLEHLCSGQAIIPLTSLSLPGFYLLELSHCFLLTSPPGQPRRRSIHTFSVSPPTEWSFGHTCIKLGKSVRRSRADSGAPEKSGDETLDSRRPVTARNPGLE